MKTLKAIFVLSLVFSSFAQAKTFYITEQNLSEWNNKEYNNVKEICGKETITLTSGEKYVLADSYEYDSILKWTNCSTYLAEDINDQLAIVYQPAVTETCVHNEVCVGDSCTRNYGSRTVGNSLKVSTDEKNNIVRYAITKVVSECQ